MRGAASARAHCSSGPKAPLIDERRYRWLEVRDERVLEALTLLPEQWQPTLYML